MTVYNSNRKRPISISGCVLMKMTWHFFWLRHFTGSKIPHILR